MFEEHHCLSFSEPLLAPPRHDGLGEDILTAWLPHDLQFSRRPVRFSHFIDSHYLFPRDAQGGLEIFDPSRGKSTWYETYNPGRRCPYSSGAHERLSSELDREWYSQDSDSMTQDDDTEEVDEYEDFVEELSSGVQDIIITGEVDLPPLSPCSLIHWLLYRPVKAKVTLGVTTRILGEFGHGTGWWSSFEFRYVTNIFQCPHPHHRSEGQSESRGWPMDIQGLHS